MGAIFDRHKILHGLPKVGQKIIFKKVKKGWFTNIEEDAKNLLVVGQEYTVRKTELNSSSTYVWLEEFPNIYDDNDPLDGRDQPFFNMGSFEWELPEVNPEELIGYGVHDMPRLVLKYQFGLEINGKFCYEGSPILSVETDAYERVTSAAFKKPVESLKLENGVVRRKDGTIVGYQG